LAGEPGELKVFARGDFGKTGEDPRSERSAGVPSPVVGGEPGEACAEWGAIFLGGLLRDDVDSNEEDLWRRMPCQEFARHGTLLDWAEAKCAQPVKGASGFDSYGLAAGHRCIVTQKGARVDRDAWSGGEVRGRLAAWSRKTSSRGSVSRPGGGSGSASASRR
jgi:hypothetical protein